MLRPGFRKFLSPLPAISMSDSAKGTKRPEGWRINRGLASSSFACCSCGCHSTMVPWPGSGSWFQFHLFLGLSKPAAPCPLRDGRNGGKASTQRSRSQFHNVPSLSFWFSTSSWTKPPSSRDLDPNFTSPSSKLLGSNKPIPSPPHPLDHRGGSCFPQVPVL